MHIHGGATATSGHSSKPKKPKSREVSSRFLSPTNTTSSTTTEYGNQSPNTTLSPLKQKPRSSTDSRKHKSLENSGFLRGLWPSSLTRSPSNSNSTLADHLGSDRQKDLEERKHRDKSDQTPFSINRQRSGKEFRSFDDDKKTYAKENHIPIFGGSMRYTGKFKFAGKSSKSSKLLDDDIVYHRITPGRFSIDENTLRKRSDTDSQGSESEYSEIYSGGTSFDTPVAGKSSPAASYMAPTMSSRKHGIEVASKFMQDLSSSSSRSRRWSADSGINNHQNKPVSSLDNIQSSPKNFNLKNAMKNSKPPTSPSRGKGVGNILSMGIELLKGKKSNSSNTTSLGSGESVHQLKLLHNRLMQWRYINGRAEAVNLNINKQVQRNFIYAWNGLTKLQQSVLQKKLQLQREKLEIKLNYILQSQKKMLDIWGNMERQHLLAVSTTKDYLHHVVCRIPLLDGAKVEPESASLTIRHASDIATSINLMLTTFSHTIEKTVRELVELAIVVTQEKLLLEECLELFRTISTLEIQERSLKSNIMQLKLMQK